MVSFNVCKAAFFSSFCCFFSAIRAFAALPSSCAAACCSAANAICSVKRSNSCSICSASVQNMAISACFSCSRRERNCLAVSLCSSNGASCPSSSEMISSTRSRFCCSFSSLFVASILRVLYLTIPVASSKIRRRSSPLALRISSILPCPTME